MRQRTSLPQGLRPWSRPVPVRRSIATMAYKTPALSNYAFAAFFTFAHRAFAAAAILALPFSESFKKSFWALSPIDD